MRQVLAEPVVVQVVQPELRMILGNGPHVASLALAIDEVLSQQLALPPPTAGCLLAIPNWHCLLVQPLDAEPSADQQAVISELLLKLFDYQDPLSPELWRWFASAGQLRHASQT